MFVQAANQHVVLGVNLLPPYPANTEKIVLGLGCFWGAEQVFWKMTGVYTTLAGYSGGAVDNPSYQMVCGGQTGHCEVVCVVYYAEEIGCEDILKTFWEAHDPTQGMRQGNDVGSQYRSAIYTSTEKQARLALASRDHYQECLNAHGFGRITTEIAPQKCFYPAEDYHQQYLAKNPSGYCGHGGTGVPY